MFGAGTDQDLRLSLELAYLQNKEKLANLKASLHSMTFPKVSFLMTRKIKS